MFVTQDLSQLVQQAGRLENMGDGFHEWHNNCFFSYVFQLSNQGCKRLFGDGRLLVETSLPCLFCRLAWSDQDRRSATLRHAAQPGLYMRDDLSNAEIFNFTALQLFAKLFDEFPQPVAIDAGSLGSETNEAFGETINDTIQMIHLAEHAVTWLAEEGFLRYEKGAIPGSRSFTNVRLTMKGLTVLGYMPSALQNPEKAKPLIARIKSVVASGAEKAGTDAVKSLLTEVFRLAASVAITSPQTPGMSA